jgi:hypothetical protein
MVIADFNVICVTIFKPEPDPPLIVDGNRILSLSIPFKRMQPIAWRISQIIEPCCEIHVPKLASRALCNI